MFFKKCNHEYKPYNVVRTFSDGMGSVFTEYSVQCCKCGHVSWRRKIQSTQELTLYDFQLDNLAKKVGVPYEGHC